MVCDLVNQEEVEKRRRAKQLADLQKELRAKSAKIARIGNRVEIQGWKTRGSWCDACAVRALRQSADASIRMMVAQAAPVNQPLTFGHGH